MTFGRNIVVFGVFFSFQLHTENNIILIISSYTISELVRFFRDTVFIPRKWLQFCHSFLPTLFWDC